MIADPQQREVLGDLAKAADILVKSKGDAEVIRNLEKGRLNLMRMWARP
jgi:predicted 2-oxoglutarate/Fe(II)-dependent dioxygenase YbiX